MTKTVVQKPKISIPEDDVFVGDVADDTQIVENFEYVPVGKPSKTTWFKTSPDKAFERLANMLDLGNKGSYMVSGEVARYLGGNLVKVVRLHLSWGVDGKPFLIPITLPDKSGRPWNQWHSSLDKAVKLSMVKPVNVVSDQNKGTNLIYTSDMPFPPLMLPEGTTMADLVNIAFQEKYIDDIEHPIIKEIKGLDFGVNKDNV